MTIRFNRSYPFLFAVIPVIRLVAAYPGWAELSDLLVIVLVVLAGSAVIYGLVLVATRRSGGRLAPMILMGAVLAFWVYVRVANLVEHKTGISHPVLFPLWIAGTVGAIWWLARRPALLDRTERFLTLTGGMLVVWFTITIALAEWRSARTLRESALVRGLARPVTVRPGAKAGPRRDIYLIVLDEYANAEVTGRLIGFDNHVFLDSLRRLGFVVPAVHSNYLHTFLSLPSLLNAAHMARLSEELGRRSLDRSLPDYLVEHNRAVRFLKSRGYQFAFFPSYSWESTQESPEADIVFDADDGWRPARAISRSGLRQVVNKTSLLKFVPWEATTLVRSHMLRTFEGVAGIPKVQGPVFTFAHVLKPHEPYIFDPDCRLTHRQFKGPRLQRKAGAYAEQIECVNGRVLRMVTALLQRSEIPPIILLQGDHGSKLLAFDTASSAEAMTLAAAKERTGAFGAYYLPDGGSQAFGDSVTVVNVMGNVLRYYFGAALPRQPDDMYLSADRAPYAFKKVDFAWLAAEDWSAPSAKTATTR